MAAAAWWVPEEEEPASLGSRYLSKGVEGEAESAEPNCQGTSVTGQGT